MTDRLLQAAAIVLWAIACFSLLHSLVKAFGRGPREVDNWKSALFFAALLFLAFPSRRFIAPMDQPSWRFLYSLSIALAVYVLLLIWNGRKP